MRPAPGRARYREALEPQMIGEHAHVVGLVSDQPSVPTVGAAVPGPVMCDQAHPEPPIEVLVRPPVEPAPGVP